MCSEHIDERSLQVPSERNLLNDYLAKILNICRCCDSSKQRKCDQHINHTLIIAKKNPSSRLQARPCFPNRFHPIRIWIDHGNLPGQWTCTFIIFPMLHNLIPYFLSSCILLPFMCPFHQQKFDGHWQSLN